MHRDSILIHDYQQKQIKTFTHLRYNHRIDVNGLILKFKICLFESRILNGLSSSYRGNNSENSEWSKNKIAFGISSIIKSKFQLLDLLIKMNLKLYIILTATVLSLLGPAAADHISLIEPASDNITTVHGEVYKWDTFEPLNNTVVDVIDANSNLIQSIVATKGQYSVKLIPGDYTIIAKYYKDSTLTYSIVDTIAVKSGGDYVYDLVLTPVRESVIKHFIQKISSQIWLMALAFFLLLGGSYQLSRKHKPIEKNISQEGKKGHAIRDFFELSNMPKIRVKVRDKSIGLEGKEPAKSKEEYPAHETELVEFRSEEENKKTSPEKPASNPEIGTHVLKNKLPLPTYLQNVMDIIRSEGGQINQKDLRNRLKYSEVKVSLILSDLEKRKKIKKVKVGRENIVVLMD
jgi:uncharacterized membrane protein